MPPPKIATEEELQQVDEEGRPYKFFLGEKVILRRAMPGTEAERLRADYEAGLYQPDLPKIESQYRPDSYIGSPNVVSLTEANFDEYIKSKEKALVYFYDANTSNQHGVRETELSVASVVCIHHNHGFAGVDCFKDRRLCDREKIKPQSMPMFKLYSNGFDLSTIECHTKLNANQMLMLMKMTPILFQPRVDTGRELLAKAVEPPKKKKKLFGKIG